MTVPFVWNELTIQVAYETELEFAQETMVEVADDLIGAELSERILARFDEAPDRVKFPVSRNR